MTLEKQICTKGRDKHFAPCTRPAVDGKCVCKKHEYMEDYTEEQLNRLEKCRRCKQWHDLFNVRFAHHCDRCATKQNKGEKCFLDGCDTNVILNSGSKYCTKHKRMEEQDLAKELGRNICKKCRRCMDEESDGKYQWCISCRERDNQLYHERTGHSDHGQTKEEKLVVRNKVQVARKQGMSEEEIQRRLGEGENSQVCRGLLKDGSKCTSGAMLGSNYCQRHQYFSSFVNPPTSASAECQCTVCHRWLDRVDNNVNKCSNCSSSSNSTNERRRPTCSEEKCQFQSLEGSIYCGTHKRMHENENYGKPVCRICRKVAVDLEKKACDECLEQERSKDKQGRSQKMKQTEEKMEIAMAEGNMDALVPCSHCKKECPFSEYIHRNGIDLPSTSKITRCQTCRDKQRTLDQQRNKDHVNELRRANERKPERQEVKKQWKENNPEKVKQYHETVHQRHYEKCDENIYRYRELMNKRSRDSYAKDESWGEAKNKKRREDLHCVYLTRKQSAYRYNREFDLTEDEFKDIVQMPCNYCGTIDEKKLFNSLDRVNSSLGYTKDNVVSACKMCNDMKNTVPVEVFLKRIEHMVSIHCFLGRKKKLHWEAFGDVEGATYNRYVQRAETKKIPFHLTKDQFEWLRKQPCYICDKPSSTLHNNGIDRVCNNEGYTYNNIMPCCGECNVMKKDHAFDKFWEKIIFIYKHAFKDKDSFYGLPPDAMEIIQYDFEEAQKKYMKVLNGGEEVEPGNNTGIFESFVRPERYHTLKNERQVSRSENRMSALTAAEKQRNYRIRKAALTGEKSSPMTSTERSRLRRERLKREREEGNTTSRSIQPKESQFGEDEIMMKTLGALADNMVRDNNIRKRYTKSK